MALQRKGAAEQRRSADGLTPGVVVLSRIPFGFYEGPMRAFFKQFGTVTRLRLARNPKVPRVPAPAPAPAPMRPHAGRAVGSARAAQTGNSRHYAFIEFESDDVAKIVAETMDAYMMFGRIMRCTARHARRGGPTVA